MPEYSPYVQRLMDMASASKGDVRFSAKITGKLLEVKEHNPSRHVWEHRRGSIKDFSPGARRRMLKRFWTINFADHHAPLFITLTYPDEVCFPDLPTRNIHRANFARNMESYLGVQFPAAWRVEWQLRKSGSWEGLPAPHWHLLAFKQQFVPYQVVNREWKKAIGWKGYLRTDIERVDKDSAIQMYMAKYLSKEAVPLSLVIKYISQQIGRSYGWLRRKQIPWYPSRTFHKLSEAEIDTLMRFADEQLPFWSQGRRASVTLTGNAAVDAGRSLGGEVLDGS